MEANTIIDRTDETMNIVCGDGFVIYERPLSASEIWLLDNKREIIEGVKHGSKEKRVS